MTKKIESGTFGCLILESCEKRWAKTVEFQRPGTLRRQLLDNEFQASRDIRRPIEVSLGSIRRRTRKEHETDFKETLKDVTSLDRWKRVKEDLVKYSDSELYR